MPSEKGTRIWSWRTCASNGGRALLMLDSAALGPVLSAIKAAGPRTPFEGIAYRSIALRHFMPPATPSPLYAAMPGRLGTRYVSSGTGIPSLYLATEVETAHREGNQPFYESLLAMPPGPVGLVWPDEVSVIGVQVRLGRILDVRDVAVQMKLGTSMSELRGPWKRIPDAPTQRLGAAVEADGEFEGLLYPSARHDGGSCLVVFPKIVKKGDFVEFRSTTGVLPDARLGPP
jgi:RES domain-containing protein